jgi:(p)ppGpp synthase/HD superfamily hydrolase
VGDGVTTLTPRFDEAVGYAIDAHRLQGRKGSTIPYVSHLLAVASLLLEAGYDENHPITGLLHDVIEDQGHEHAPVIRERFGDAVADGVLECSAKDKSDGLGWRERKMRYLAVMAAASPMAVRVSLADKVHNLRSIVEDYRRQGDAMFRSFNAPEPQFYLWYFGELDRVYSERSDALFRGHLQERRRQLEQLEQLMRRPDCPRCGAGDVVPIVTGLPGGSLFDQAARGEVELRACCVTGDDPDWRCRRCMHAWS